MQNALDWVERLAATARKDSPPEVTVANDVLRRLRVPERAPLAWVTACAVAAMALIMLLAAWPSTTADPLDTLFQAADFIQPEKGI